MVENALRVAIFWQAIVRDWLNKYKLLASPTEKQGFQMYHMKLFGNRTIIKEILVKEHFPTLAQKSKIW